MTHGLSEELSRHKIYLQAGDLQGSYMGATIYLRGVRAYRPLGQSLCLACDARQDIEA